MTIVVLNENGNLDYVGNDLMLAIPENEKPKEINIGTQNSYEIMKIYEDLSQEQRFREFVKEYKCASEEMLNEIEKIYKKG